MKYNRKITKIPAFILLLLSTTVGTTFGFETQIDTLAVISPEYEFIEGDSVPGGPYRIIKRPKIGLALSGGGLRGIAQLGVIKTLADHDIPIDYIVGSSIGALVGGLIASGYSAEELWEIAQEVDWSSVLDDTPQRSTLFLGEKEERGRAALQFRLDGLKPSLPEAYTPGFKLTDILTSLIINAPFHSEDFGSLAIPLKILATDLYSGKKIVFTRGDLTEVIRASIAIPLLLTPIRMDSMLLVDGGVLDNIPVDETRKSGADLVIAVNTTSPLRTPSDMEMPWEVLDQVTTIMQFGDKTRQLSQADFIVDFTDIAGTSTDIQNYELFYNEGQKRTHALLDSIKAVLHSPPQLQEREYFIEKVQTTGLRKEDHEGIVTEFSYSKKSNQEIYDSLLELHETGAYDSLRATVVLLNGMTLLRVDAQKFPLITGFKFTGNRELADSVLVSIVKPLLNSPFNRRVSQSISRKIIAAYRQQGLSLATVKKIDLDDGGKIEIQINEGTIGDLAFLGNRITRDFVIRREFHVKPNTTFRLTKMQEGLSNLYASGLFNSLIFKVRPNGERWDCSLSMSERLPHVVRIGLNYNRERNGRSFLEFSDENFWGTGNDLTVHGLYGDRDGEAEITYRADRVFETLFSGSLDLHYVKSKHFSYRNFKGTGEYERRSFGAIFSMGRHIERFGMLSAFMRMERIHLRTISGTGFDAGKLNVNTLGFTTTVDTRDRIPFPKRGKFYNFLYEVSGGDFLTADISYFKVQNTLSSFVTFFKRSTLVPKLLWGTSDLTTPYSEQFRIGGMDSFYGIRQGEMQGRHLIVGSLEYRYWLPTKFFFDTYLSVRFDMGAVWENVLEIQAEDFIGGKGVAVSFDTPLGPFEFAYGWAANGRKEIYFKAGYDF